MRFWTVAVFLAGAASAQAELLIPPRLTQAGLANSPLARAGYLDATAYGADPSGKTDSTAAIQAAINDGVKYAMTTYLPSGTYAISRTLNGEAMFSGSGCVTAVDVGARSRLPQSPRLVGPATGQRPLLKLVPGAAGFGNASKPSPAIFFQLVNPGMNWLQAAPCFMYSAIRDVDVELGGNKGAIGIQFAAAQYSYLENVSVDATGAYAGIYGVPSVESVANISVVGGEYGIIPATCCGISIAGLTLKNQTVAGLRLDNYGTTMVSGFSITESSGVAVSNSDWGQTSGAALIDGTIVMSGVTGPAISDPGGHNLYLRNVYVTTPGSLIESGKEGVAASGGNDLIEEYSFTNAVPATNTGLTTTSFTLLNGVRGQSPIVTVKLRAPLPPHDLVERHLPGQLPWFQDKGVIDVTTLGADPTGKADSTAAIQSALIKGTEVFLPRGEYSISATLKLGTRTRLFGVPPFQSRIFGFWNTGGHVEPMIQSPSSDTGTTRIDDLWLQPPSSAADNVQGYAGTYIGGVDWQTGRSSIVRQLAVYLGWTCHLVPGTTNSCDGNYFTSAARDLVHIEGKGGGRWYGLQLGLEAHHVRNRNPDFRALLIEGTTAPLTLYGANPEHEENMPFVEFRNAKNVRFLGSKSEGVQYEINHSQNVMFAAHTANGDDLPQLLVVDSDQVLAPVTGLFFGQGDANAFIVKEVLSSGATATLPGSDQCSLLTLGQFDDAPFPRCGDRVCDGAENTTNCPTDCGSSVRSALTSQDDGTSNGVAGSLDASEVEGGCSSAGSFAGGAPLALLALLARSLRRLSHGD